VGDAQIEKWLGTDNLWKVPARHRGAIFNYIQRKAIEKRNEQMHVLVARYNETSTRYRYGNFETNAILLRQQKIVGGEKPRLAEPLPNANHVFSYHNRLVQISWLARCSVTACDHD
jgi:hypothetical protein